MQASMTDQTRDSAFKPHFNLRRDVREMLGVEHCPLIRRSEDIAELFSEIGTLDREVMVAGALDVKCRLVQYELLSVGTSDHMLLRVADAFQGAMRSNASAIILAHNHPSGSLTPSDHDMDLTQRVAEAGLLLGYPLLDHVIITRNGHRSLISPGELQKRAKRRIVEHKLVVAADDATAAGWRCPSCQSLNKFSLPLPPLVMRSAQTCVPVRCVECRASSWLQCSPGAE